MERVFIVGSCRTPIGKMGGVLSSLTAVDLGSIVIREALQRSNIPASEVDHVYMGNVLQSCSGQNVARQAAIKAGLPYSTTAETLNLVCGSGLDAVNSAARYIQSGEANIVIAGGHGIYVQRTICSKAGKVWISDGKPYDRHPPD